MFGSRSGSEVLVQEPGPIPSPVAGMVLRYGWGGVSDTMSSGRSGSEVRMGGLHWYQVL